ncbi:recombinase family protein [Sinorhizobium sp. BG8]|uniref:recombinase family protein n=1 Tax=Sinorhizobium sp. BG8 TaxID=2613773 RepID=UPI00193E1E31|nr:recombinase family protein [Sinorhizobium sp. BG8]QRM56398.1 recombinase family protein [Sinorhizobium sp. BG8]
MFGDEIESIGVVRAVAYVRVSTGRQAESDLSIPDQINQISSYCANKGWLLVCVYSDATTGTDDNRQEFQRMIERAKDRDRPYDVILIHSYSRIFRDHFSLEMYIRSLSKHDVRLVSITQEFGDDPAHVMMRQMISLFDEYQSKETGKHVLRSMKENARQGFYNGAPLPLGYSAVEVERRGARIKKHIVLNEAEAEIVRLIFRLYRQGQAGLGPMGIKRIVSFLNDQGYLTRKGAHFGIGSVSQLLRNRIYTGEYIFNRRQSKTKQLKPKSEQITIVVPAIISVDEFEEVQRKLHINSPKITPPRTVTSTILLGGLAFCASCGGAMTLRTGTSRNGKVHRYYNCSMHQRAGTDICAGRSVRMDTLDDLVTSHLRDRLLNEERIAQILALVAENRGNKAAESNGRVATLQNEKKQIEMKLARVYRMVEEGDIALDEILKERIVSLRGQNEQTALALELARGQVALQPIITKDAISEFATVMRTNIAEGEMSFRKAYFRSVVHRIEVADEEIRIVGINAGLEKAVAGGNLPCPPVRVFERKWRTRQDSNL